MTTANEDSSFGLGKDWAKILQILEDIMPVYDKTNRYISLGTDMKLRKRGVSLLVETIGKPDFVTLDMGCGTGKMASELGFAAPAAKDSIVLLDPIPSMSRLARSRTGCEAIISVFEFLPFRERSFDAATAGFSIRDAKDLQKALEEINAVLKKGGRFLIVDLAKPNSRLKSSVIWCYWKLLAPLIALLSSGRPGLKFGALAKTFERLPRISRFLSLINDCGFDVARAEFHLMGGSCALLLVKNLPKVV